MESKSLRYNEEKPKWSLVHYKSLEPMVRVLEMGSKKYSADNWKIGLNRSEILESTMRHLTALMDGELLDKESGISHMAHIQCNAMFYNYHEANNSFSKSVSEIPLKEDGQHSFQTEEVDSSTAYVEAMTKLVDESTWSERKKATFKFFNEFSEPYRSQAKYNYDETYSKEIPVNPLDSLDCGFNWSSAPEGISCWGDFAKTLKDE